VIEAALFFALAGSAFVVVNLRARRWMNALAAILALGGVELSYARIATRGPIFVFCSIAAFLAAIWLGWFALKRAKRK
jgi:hypothetical protein